MDKTVEQCCVLLGVSLNADQSEIKSAYRVLAQRHHPDHCHNDAQRADYTRRMAEINLAYHRLLDWRTHLSTTQTPGSSLSNAANHYTPPAGPTPTYAPSRPTVSDAEARWNQGVSLSEAGQWQNAISVFQSILLVHPQFAPALLSMAWCYVNLQCIDEAIGCYLRYLALNNANATAWDGLGNCYSLLAQWEQSEACLVRAVELDPYESIHHYNLGRLCFWMERWQESFEHYRDALCCNSNCVLSRMGLANLLWYTGDQVGAWREQNYLQSVDPQAAHHLSVTWQQGCDLMNNGAM